MSVAVAYDLALKCVSENWLCFAERFFLPTAIRKLWNHRPSSTEKYWRSSPDADHRSVGYTAKSARYVLCATQYSWREEC